MVDVTTSTGEGNMQLGAYSFGDVQADPQGRLGSTADAIRNLFDAITLADAAGLDYFGVGEHHTREMPASAPATVLAAAAGATKNITLGSSVTVLSTEDPVRVFQQFATIDAISGGRAEITAGRGSSVESFPLFGFSLGDYDDLYAEKLELLLALNENERVTWNGTFRPALDDALIVPRPVNGTLPIWLGTGGNPSSSIRAGKLGLPVAYGIIGGYADRFAPLTELYRQTAFRAGHDASTIKVAVASPGLVAPTSQGAKDIYYEAWFRMMTELGKLRGFRPPTRPEFDAQANGRGAILAGSPSEVADRLITLHQSLGHTRHILQMDVGNLPQATFLQSIELLATEVLPAVRQELGEDSIELVGAAEIGASEGGAA
ncbi:LLM class flavin-dependent oxidoreductase [Leifsonia sp. YAF41]|uniref:LLM class flavin-dependent oxidoreductase n=1 Tax=Leifsonia sp. YAF41 TaxID=3233086 RepID=UPI003F9E5F53